VFETRLNRALDHNTIHHRFKSSKPGKKFE